MEFVEKGDLLEYLNGSDDLSENEIRTLFQQLVLGMAHCHKEKVVHRDIKCENILLDAKGRLKITGKMVTDQYRAATLSLFSSHRQNWFAARCEYLHLIRKNSRRANTELPSSFQLDAIILADTELRTSVCDDWKRGFRQKSHNVTLIESHNNTAIEILIIF